MVFTSIRTVRAQFPRYKFGGRNNLEGEQNNLDLRVCSVKTNDSSTDLFVREQEFVALHQLLQIGILMPSYFLFGYIKGNILIEFVPLLELLEIIIKIK